MHDANLALLSIKLGKIHTEVLKQIAPYFNFNIGSVESNNSSESSESDDYMYGIKLSRCASTY